MVTRLRTLIEKSAWPNLIMDKGKNVGDWILMMICDLFYMYISLLTLTSLNSCPAAPASSALYLTMTRFMRD